jgi:hypothetical protein
MCHAKHVRLMYSKDVSSVDFDMRSRNVTDTQTGVLLPLPVYVYRYACKGSMIEFTARHVL